MVADGLDGFGDVNDLWCDATDEEIASELSHPSDQRVMAIAAAFQRSMHRFLVVVVVGAFFFPP